MIVMREDADLGITVIDTETKLTAENARELLKAVQSLPAMNARRVIVNMEQTSIVDSSGIGTLVHAMKHLRSVNGSLVLAGVRPTLLRSFHLMNLHYVFDIFDTEALARQQWNERG